MSEVLFISLSDTWESATGARRLQTGINYEDLFSALVLPVLLHDGSAPVEMWLVH